MLAFWTRRSDGDQRPGVEAGSPRARAVPGDLVVAGVHQVHGGDVALVGRGSHRHGAVRPLPDADAALATDDVTCAAVLVADCVPIAIGSPEGIRVAVHAGWRGLVAGVVQNAASAARAAGASSLVAGVGPSIGPCCYEFGRSEIDEVQAALGAGVGATTSSGAPALDLRAAARRVLEQAGVELCFWESGCTSCSPGWYSARARKDSSRQALYVWRTTDRART